MPTVIYHLFVIVVLMDVVLCNNVTRAYNTMHAREFQSRTNRLLSFNTQHNGEISMELAFNVPFISIPVKKSIEMAHGALANINIGALVLAGAVAVGFGLIFPGIGVITSKKSRSSSYRSDDHGKWWQYLEVVDKILSENDVDSTSCVQQVVCWVVRNSTRNVIRGYSSNSDKIIDALATSKVLQPFVKGTILHEAVTSGLHDTDCSKHFTQCKVSQNLFETLTATIHGFL